MTGFNGNFSADPQLRRLPARGADLLWGTNDDDYGNLRLMGASPCIDSGSNSSVTGVTMDLDGHPRFFDDPANPDCRFAPGTCGTAPIVDVGAYEFTPSADLDDDGDVDGDDLSILNACAAGPGIPSTSACANTDLDRDGDTDQDDFGRYQRCYGGPGVAVSTTCLN